MLKPVLKWMMCLWMHVISRFLVTFSLVDRYLIVAICNLYSLLLLLFIFIACRKYGHHQHFPLVQHVWFSLFFLFFFFFRFVVSFNLLQMIPIACPNEVWKRMNNVTILVCRKKKTRQKKILCTVQHYAIWFRFFHWKLFKKKKRIL